MNILPLVLGLGVIYAITKKDVKKTSSSINKSMMQQALEQNGFYFTDKVAMIDLNNQHVAVNFHDFAAKLVQSNPIFLQMYQSEEMFNGNIENYLAQFIEPINPSIVKCLSIKSNNKTTNIIFFLMVRMGLNAYETAIKLINPNIDEDMLNKMILSWESDKIYSYGITPDEIKAAMTKLKTTGKFS